MRRIGNRLPVIGHPFREYGTSSEVYICRSCFHAGNWTRYDITPVPAPRQVRSDRWDPRPRVVRYRKFRDLVRLAEVTLPPHPHIVFVLPMPPSWSEKRKRLMDGKPHTQKPDRDNCEKALLDSVYSEDCQVWDARSSKVWGRRGSIYVRAIEPPVLP